MAIIGAVGVTAAVVNGMSRYDYYRRSRPVVVVPSQPSTVVVERPVIVERTVTVEKQVAADSAADGTYSPKLGASFRIEKIQIPGNKFVAARLMSDPVEGSPLEKLKLRQGDVITRLDDSAADSLSELDRHERNTLIRYIRTGTTKVVMAKVYIPTDEETPVLPDDEYHAP
jgi:S1-C subfamily serine protease